MGVVRGGGPAYQVLAPTSLGVFVQPDSRLGRVGQRLLGQRQGQDSRGGSPEQGQQGATTAWWRGQSLLLTWNGDWGLLPSSPTSAKLLAQVGAPYGELAAVKLEADRVAACVEQLSAHLRQSKQVVQLWADAEEFVTHLCRRYFFADWAFSLELSVSSWLTDGTVRLHLHAWLYGNRRRAIMHADYVRFRRSLPVLSQSAFVKARACSKAAASYYLSAPKVGVVLHSASLSPHEDYMVQPQWVWNLLAGNKMSSAAARCEFTKQARDLPRLLACLDRFIQERKQSRMREVSEKTWELLESQRRPFRRLVVVEDWIAEHKKNAWRYRFLVLTGPSKTGKTQFALGLVAAGRSLELNMAASDEPDLRDYDYEKHDLLLLDEMSAKSVLSQKNMAGSAMLGFSRK